MGFFRRRPKLAIALGAVVVLLIGVGIGSAGTGNSSSPTTVTHTVTVMGHKKVDRVVPAACKQAIAAARLMASNASKGFDLAGNVLPLVGDMITAAADQDAAKLTALTARVRPSTAAMKALGPKIAADSVLFNAAASRCR